MASLEDQYAVDGGFNGQKPTKPQFWTLATLQITTPRQALFIPLWRRPSFPAYIRSRYRLWFALKFPLHPKFLPD